MKNILLIWLTAIIPLITVGQKLPAVVEIDLSNYVTQERLNELEKRIQALESGNGVVKPVDPVVPGKDDCKAGLKIISITKITNTSANVTFDAVDARSIDYRIVSALDTTKVHSFGNVAPNTSQFPISYASLTPGQYRLLIDAANCNGHSGRNFTVSTPLTPITGCKEGPTIKDVKDINPSGLTILFHGVDVRKLVVDTRRVDGGLVQSDTISPSSSELSIRYKENLTPGNYLLKITGVSCSGGGFESTPFKISNSVGGGGTIKDPEPVIPVKPVTPGDVSIISKGLDEQMQITWKKDSKGYLVSDVSNPSIGTYNEFGVNKDYEFRYIIGGEILTTGKNPLTNYRISGNNPGRILKYKIKPRRVLNQWEHGGGYYDWETGEHFSYNSSVAFLTFGFPGASSDFVNPLPANYNPAIQNVQWGDIAQDMQMPKGHIYVADPRPWGINHARRKGVTHISNYALPWDNVNEVLRLQDAGETYDDVPRIETKFQITKSGNTGELWPDNTSKDWWPRGAPSEAEGYEIGRRAVKSHALFIGEMSENESWLPPYSPAFRGFYKGFREGYEERFGKRGIPFYICHDYIWLGGEKMNTGKGRDFYKRILKLPIDQQPANDYTPGGSLVNTNLIVETVYLGAPDGVLAQPTELIFRLKYIKQLGYTAGTFIAFVHEWKPNNMLEIIYPEGKMYPHVKASLDPNTLIANGFIAQVFGNLFIEWGGAVKTPDKLLPRNWYGTGFQWCPNGSTSPQRGFPYFKETEGYPTYYGYNGSTDLVHFSQKLFVDTYAPVEGGKDEFLSYRLDGGKWITPTEEDFIDAY
ncbi:MAG TPA: hypothetical protein VGN64_09230, partial [Dyadobacter sp.]|nr:hypothetical protein [Dyadobacter sp.]